MKTIFSGLPRWLQLAWALIAVYLVVVLIFFWLWGWSVLPFPL